MTANSILTKDQKKTFGPVFFSENKYDYRITVTVRYDDDCGNGHNSFAITASIEERRGNKWIDARCGTCHDDVAKRFPKLGPYIKWHLTSSDGPMHYFVNTCYWVKEGNLANARSSAVWPEATDSDLSIHALAIRLGERLPALMDEFRKAVESLGFTY